MLTGEFFTTVDRQFVIIFRHLKNGFGKLEKNDLFVVNFKKTALNGKYLPEVFKETLYSRNGPTEINDGPRNDGKMDAC